MIASSRKVPLRTLPAFFSLAKKTGTRDFSCFLIKNRLPYSRLSILVPKSVSKKATQRNKIKRKLYELIGGALVQKGTDLVIRVYRQPTKDSLHQFYEQNKRFFCF